MTISNWHVISELIAFFHEKHIKVFSCLKVECAMKSTHGFTTALLESIRLLPKNGKLMSLIACSSILFSLFSLYLFGYAVGLLTDEMFDRFLTSFMPGPDSFNSFDPYSFNSSDPTPFTPKMGFDPAQMMASIDIMKGDLAKLLALEIASLLAFSTILFFSSVSTIVVSTFSYSDKSLQLNELVSIVLKVWTRPLISSSYVSCLSTGYFSIVLILASPLLMHPDLAFFWVAVFVGIPASVLYLHLLVNWVLSIVISVVEESCYGMEALGKAAVLVEGKGFLLNLLCGLLVSVIFKGHGMVAQYKGPTTLSWVLATVVLCLLSVFQMVAYTALYLQWKEQHGEEVGLHGSFQYSKVPAITAVLGNDMS